MKKIICLVTLLLSSSLWAFIYECSGGGYSVKILNPELVAPNTPALVISGSEGASTVLASNLQINANFEIEVSGRTVAGTFVRYISMAIDDPGVSAGQQINGKMNLDTQKGSINVALICKKGPSSLP